MLWRRKPTTNIGRGVPLQDLKGSIRKIGITDPIVWVVCPAACDIAIRMKPMKMVYQRTDCFEEFPNVDTDKIGRFDKKLKANADLTIYVNKTLYDNEKSKE